MFRVACKNNLDAYTDTVTEFIMKCIGDVVPTVTIKTYPNHKPWIDGSIRVKQKARTTAFNNGKATGNMAEYKQCNYSLRKAIKQAKRQYRDKVQSQFNGSDTRRMWQGLQTITDYQPFRRDRRLAFGQAKHIRNATGPDLIPSRVFRACSDQLAGGLRAYSIFPYPSLLSQHASRWPPLFLFPRSQR